MYFLFYQSLYLSLVNSRLSFCRSDSVPYNEYEADKKLFFTSRVIQYEVLQCISITRRMFYVRNFHSNCRRAISEADLDAFNYVRSRDFAEN